MQTLTLSDGQVFRLAWFSKILSDGSLRFGVLPEEQTAVEIFEAFLNEEATAELIYNFDEYSKKYEGYSSFKQLTIDGDCIEIVMRKSL